MNRHDVFRAAVRWIARNDSSGDDPAHPDAAASVAEYITTLLVADLLIMDPATVARAVIRERIADATRSARPAPAAGIRAPAAAAPDGASSGVPAGSDPPRPAIVVKRPPKFACPICLDTAGTYPAPRALAALGLPGRYAHGYCIAEAQRRLTAERKEA